jgi:hypothetical protein
MRRLFLGYVLDIVGPFLTYLVAHLLGVRAVWALTSAGIAAGVGTTVNSLRRKGLDPMGLLVLLELAASLLLLLLVRDRRLLLVRPSLYTAVAAGYLVWTALAGRPLSFEGARPMAARGGPERLAAYERAWDRSSAFRRTHFVTTVGFAAALVADSLVRVLIVYRLPVERAPWLAGVPHSVIIALILGASALVGRRLGRLVDEQMA